MSKLSFAINSRIGRLRYSFESAYGATATRITLAAECGQRPICHTFIRLALTGDGEAAISLDLDLQRLGHEAGAVIRAHRVGDLDDLLGREELR